MGNGCSSVNSSNAVTSFQDKPWSTHKNYVKIGPYKLDVILINKNELTSIYRICLPWTQFGLPLYINEDLFQAAGFEPHQYIDNWQLDCSVLIDGKTISLGSALEYKNTETVISNDATKYVFCPNLLQVGTNDKCVRIAYDRETRVVRPLMIRIANKYLSHQSTESHINFQKILSTVEELKNLPAFQTVYQNMIAAF